MHQPNDQSEVSPGSAGLETRALIQYSRLLHPNQIHKKRKCMTNKEKKLCIYILYNYIHTEMLCNVKFGN